MIRRLRLKFIAIVLAVVLVIILALGIIINVSVTSGTYSNSDEFIDNFYEFVTQTDYLPGRTDADNGLPINGDLFFIRTQADGSFLADDFENIIGMDSDEALKLAEATISANDEYGIVDAYRYRIYTDDAGDQIIVFEKFDDNLLFLQELRKTTLLAGIIIFLITAVIAVPISGRVAAVVEEQLNTQNEFITNASHDLKTPIAVIGANMDVLSLNGKDNQWIESTKKQVNYLKRLVNHIVTTSKLNEKGFATPFEDFDLSHAANDVTNQFTTLAAARGLVYTQSIETDITYRGSEIYIRQLLAILCENAIHYSNESGRIALSLRRHQGNICFTIYNTRDPDDEIEINKLFDRFYRGDKSRSSDKYGNGLGLSMAKSIVEMHGGTITAQCKTEDSITFTVILKG